MATATKRARARKRARRRVRAFVLSSVHQKLFVLRAVTNHKSQICDCDSQAQMRYGNAPLSTLSSTDRSRPLSSPPPPLVASRRVASRRVASRRVVPRPRLSRLRCRSEETAALPHPSPSRRRRGKIPSILCVTCPPPLVASSNICSRSRQRDNIAAPCVPTR